MKKLVTMLTVAIMLSASLAFAADLPATKLKVVGGFSNLNASETVEKPFWTKTIPEKSGGKITVEYTTLGQMGLKGPESMRMVKNGVIDFVSANLSHISVDNPAFEALDVAGLLPTFEMARKASDSYFKIFDRHMRETYNAKLLMVWPMPPQVIYSIDKITGLADLKGKKMRAGNRTTADFIKAIGGVPVSVPWPDVVPAFQRGAIDGGVTGSLSGNTANWWEVTNYLMPLNLGWALWFNAVSLKKWDSLDKSVQTFLEEETAKAQELFWQNAKMEVADGINCNTGQGPCTFGKKGAMKLVPVSDGDIALLKKLVKTETLPRWAKSCGQACVDEFNDTVSEIIGIKAQIK
jgi:TRAP-type C4-dicarboxylate transport system substrate-binding protein